MRTRINVLILGLALMISVAIPTGTAEAQQTGSVVGTVVTQEGAPVSGAQVTIPGTGLRQATDARGSYRFASVPAGTWQLQAFQLGFREVRIDDVQVTAGQETRVNVTLDILPIALTGIVVSPGRRAQRQTEAPATVTRVGTDEIMGQPGGSFANALKQVKGLDFIQVGVTGVAVNARGFNSSFNNRMLMMEDGRIAVLPESGLPLGQFTPIPQIDLAGVEVLVGPGSALYGPDASSGVISLESKDPRDFPGTSAMVTAGSRSYQNVQVRHAGVADNLGYKVTAEYHSVNDFENRLNYGDAENPLWEVGTGGNFHPDSASGVEWQNQAIRGQGSLVYYMDESRVELGAGASRLNGVGQTNVGRNQFDDWTYNYLQARFTTPGWFFNLYRTQSQSGDSYALNRFTENRAANEDPTDDEIRLGSDWPSDGRLLAAEVQNQFTLGALRGSEITWGAQYRRDAVSSDRQWLTDRLTGEDVIISQLGVYGQVETPITPELRLVLAARVDDHENYDTQFSPKAGVVWSPSADQAVRFTYNRAFKSPTILQTNFWIPDFVPFVGVFHNTDGFIMRNADGDEVARLDPLTPESNQTWELGYRGVLGDRFLVDVAGYVGSYQDFMSPLTVFANPFGATIFSAEPTTAYWASGEFEGQPVTNEDGGPQIPLTYWNLGEADIRGLDFGGTFIVNPRVDVKSTFSYVGLSSDRAEGGPAQEATALNSPSTKWSLGIDGREFNGFGGGATLRYVNGYNFQSGINQGKIPTHTALDLTLRYQVPGTGLHLNASAQNLFACGGESAGAERSCGIDQPYIQMVNMPALGSIFLIGARWEL